MTKKKDLSALDSFEFHVDIEMLAERIARLRRKEEKYLPVSERRPFRDIREAVFDNCGIVHRYRYAYRSVVGSILGSRPKRRNLAASRCVSNKRNPATKKSDSPIWIIIHATKRSLAIQTREFWTLEYVSRQNRPHFVRHYSVGVRTRSLPSSIRKSGDMFAAEYFKGLARERPSPKGQAKLAL